MSAGKHIIFVYGTLKQGWGNHRCIEGQEYLGHGQTLYPNYQMYSLGGFPGVVAGNKQITGELYAVDDEAFARCDRLEGHPTFYKRQQIPVVIGYVDDGGAEHMSAWMYIYQGQVSDCQPIDVW